MDPRHLRPDEFAYELQLRNIHEDDNRAYERLCGEIMLEESGEAEPPHDVARITRSSVTREFKECDSKLNQITHDLDQAIKVADDEGTEQGQSRLIHLAGRVARLEAVAGGHAAVSRLGARIRELRKLAGLARDSIGAGELGAAALQDPLMEEPHEEPVTNQPSVSGTIPKTTRASSTVQQPLVQLDSNVPTLRSLNPLAAEYRDLQPRTGRWSSSNEKDGPPRDSLRSFPTRSMGSLEDIWNSSFPTQPQQLAPSVQQLFEDPAVIGSGLNQQPRRTDERTANPRRPLNYSEHQRPFQNQPILPPPEDLDNLRLPRHYQQPRWQQQQQANFVQAAPGIPIERQRSLQNHHPQVRQFDRVPSPYVEVPRQPVDNSLVGGHRIHQWALRFDGSSKGLDAADFIFRVERQAQLYGVSDRALVIGVGSLLSGRASDWYWNKQRQAEDMTWPEWKHAFLSRYAPQRDSDFKIRAQIEKRLQSNNESFNDFCQDIEAFTVRLSRRMQENELIEILRRNMATHLRLALWRQPTTTVDELVRYCSELEELRQEGFSRMNTRRPFHVQEFDVEYLADTYYPEDQHHDSQQDYRYPSVEAVRMAAARTNLMICWNCKDIGHSFRECKLPQQEVFCFTCGEPGVIKMACRKCSENGKKDVLVADATRSFSATQPPKPFQPRAAVQQHSQTQNMQQPQSQAHTNLFRSPRS